MVHRNTSDIEKKKHITYLPFHIYSLLFKAGAHFNICVQSCKEWLKLVRIVFKIVHLVDCKGDSIHVAVRMDRHTTTCMKRITDFWKIEKKKETKRIKLQQTYVSSISLIYICIYIFSNRRVMCM